MLFVPLLSCFFATASAVPALNKRLSLSPSVTIKNGTVVGSSNGLIESFKGIPFAEPPTGALRLKPPHSITTTYGTITATGIPTACPQFLTTSNLDGLPTSVLTNITDLPIVQEATVSGEDCLTLNVQRPALTTSSSKLPVVFWIYGGGFEFGSTQQYDGSEIISKSVALGEPALYVAVNYRLGGFGFLAGKELQADGSTNLGLRDQRKGLEWVAENIQAFGGDPDKVTIWGESAGSISVLDQMIINGGDSTYNGKPLFRGAMMDSGSLVPAVQVSEPKAQNIYDMVVSAAGCAGSADTLACLRSVSYTVLLNAVNSVPGIFSYSAVDLSYLPRPDNSSTFFSDSPEVSVENGAYTKVPIIIGDQEDEGTLFSLVQSNITTTDQLITYFASYFPHATRDQVAEYVNTYPDDPSYGSPFNTGVANNLYPQFKRLAAILGDSTFILTRRSYLSLVAGSVPAWSYLSSYFYGTPILGTFHATDIVELFDNPAELVNPVPANAILTYYVSFINGLTPNGPVAQTALLENWPQWENSTRELVHFEALNTSIITDDFRQANYEVLTQYTTAFRV